MTIHLFKTTIEGPSAVARDGQEWSLSDGRVIHINPMAGRVVAMVEAGACHVFDGVQLKYGTVLNAEGIALVSLGKGVVVPNHLVDIGVAKMCLDIRPLFRVLRRKIVVSCYTMPTELYEGCTVDCYKSRHFGGPVMIYGRTQSGKTREACVELCRSIQTYQCPGIFFVRALKGERSSQTAALSKFAREIDPTIDVVEVTSGDDGVAFQRLQQAVRVDTPTGNTTLFILMGNDTTLRRASNQLRSGDRLRYIVALDEADIYMKGDSKVESKTWTRLRPLLDGAFEQYYITATPLDVIGTFDPEEKPRIVLTKFALADHVVGDETYYRSLHSAERRDLPIPTNSVDDAIENGQQILAECFRDGLHSEYFDLDLPMFFLHFHTERVTPNGRIAEAMSQEFFGDDEVVALTFDNEAGHSGGARVKVYRGGRVVSHNIDDLSVAISWILTLGIKVIYFLGGKTCSRAFRVTDSDHRVYPSVMIYNYNDNCGDGALLDQRMGRMNGLSPLELKCRQYIFSSEQNLNRSLDVVDACSEIVSGWIGIEGSPFETVSDEVKRPPRYSRRTLSRTRAEKSFAVDPTMTSAHSHENGLVQRSIGETEDPREVRERRQGRAKLTKQIEDILVSVGIRRDDMAGYREWRLENGDRGHDRLYALLEERHPGWEKDAKTHYPGGVKAGIRVWMQRFGVIPFSA